MNKQIFDMSFNGVGDVEDFIRKFKMHATVFDWNEEKQANVISNT